MLRVHIHQFTTTEHPFIEALTQQLTEHGHSICSMEQGQVILCMGEELQGFDQPTIQQIEAQLEERFMGAELFIQARAFPFARIRVGLNAEHQLIIASPVDESTLFRIVRLLEQYNRLSPATFEQQLGVIPMPLPEATSSHPPFAEATSTRTPPIQITQQNGPTTQNHLPQSWKDRLDHWHLSSCEHLFQVPPELSHASIQHVLNSTTNRQTRQDPFGRLLCIYGFPDLYRPNSRVLLVTSDGGCIALHRKNPTAILSPMVEDLLFSAKHPIPQWARTALGEDTAFGIDGTKVYGVETDSIYSISNQNNVKRIEGSAFSTVASLLLHWSRR